MTPRRAGWLAGTVALAAVGGWIWWRSLASPRAPGEDPAEYAGGLIANFVTVGAAFALAAAVVAWWIARKAVGRDGAERLLALETSSLNGERDRWGTAMRAELAGIDDPVERGRFGRSAAAAALRRGTGMWPVVIAAVAGVAAAVVVFSASRISFDRVQGRGIIGEPIMGLVPLIIVVSVIAGTLIGGSFRAGLETALLAWLAVYVCSVAVEIPQAVAWFDDDGVLLLDGEGAANHGVDALAAALQPLTHSAFVFVAVSQLVVAVLAAAFAAMALRTARRFGMPRDPRARPTSP